MQRIGVFVCWCGTNIAGTVDVQAVSEALKNEPGDRVAQFLVMPVITAQFIEVDSLDETERGAGGFGSTGVK